ncbi:flagellar biosynthetic protein FliO [Granulicella sp. S190]|uniref:flagellar biosynthetic protein FliO n=1 Tax=Granulicella sp. S190 TaxID=1747226 RepID=UPI00131BE6CD|nr:flagellar biosynthetic protein FliO [Granulicella sp. S190]
MQLLDDTTARRSNGTMALDGRGLAGWVLGCVRSWRGQGVSQQKQLQLVETLPLGGKRQLMLVTCAGERFLVGGSFESVETIVRLKADAPLGVATEGQDKLCR